MLKPVSNISSLAANQPNFETIPVTTFASLDEADWIIEDIIPQGELVVVFGEPGCGKTFLSLDMAMSIARGIEWERKATTLGRVIYICAEGTHGFKKRTLAYLVHHRIDISQPLALDVIPNSPDFLSDFDVPYLAKAILKNDPPSVIIVDTFSRVMAGGNENSGEDMGQAIQQCKILHQLTSAIIILIHHSGKDGAKGARGWSGLLGACDTEIEVRKIGNSHKAKITKQKDGEMGHEWGFDLLQVDLGRSPKGKMITSCVYQSTNFIPLEQKIPEKPQPTGRNQLKAMEVFAQYNINNKLEFGEYIRLLAREMPADGDSTDKDKRGNSKKTILKLIDKQVLDIDQNLVYKL